MEPNINFISLHQLAERIRTAIESAAGGEQWVVAEVSEVKVNYAGHCYLELVERTTTEQTPRAVARAVIWSRTYKLIAGYFRFQTGSDIEAGMKILVKCSVNYHPVYGLSLVISDIDPTYTIGEVERLKQQTIARLEKEGVFDMNHDCEVPLVVQHIAVVSSAQAAGYQDFLNELDGSPYRFEVELFASVMQGQEAERSVVEALERVVDSGQEFDVVAIIRGGGSQNDLACFNSYEICANIAQFPIPVFTGIGHHKDVSVADMVAAKSMKTPTAVATTLVEMAREFDTQLTKLGEAAVMLAERTLTEESRRIDHLGQYLGVVVRDRVHSESMRIAAAAQKIGSLAYGGLALLSQRLEGFHSQLRERAQGRIAYEIQQANTMQQSLKTATTSLIERNKQQLELLESRVEGHNPRQILGRGYSILHSQGRLVRSSADIAIGDQVEMELADAKVEVKVLNISNAK